MHRVITRRLDHRGNWIVEVGPWLAWQSDAENWATILGYLGYDARVESMSGHQSIGHPHRGFGGALPESGEPPDSFGASW